MKIIVVTDDAIFPANSGGRQELLGECVGLRAAGCEVSLVVSHRLELDERSEDNHRSIASQVTFLKRRGFFRSTLEHPLLPYQMSSRRKVSPSILMRLQQGAPIGVIASHEWTVPIAADIASRLQIPLILRSHNDEVAYMKALAAHAGGLKRIYFALEGIRLLSTLKNLYSPIQFAAVLSESDKTAYESYGVNTYYIPPVLTLSDQKVEPEIVDANNRQIILFVGALDMPQTASGVRWFCDEVLPRIRTAIPNVELHIAGRRSPARFADYLDSAPGVVFHGEVDDLAPLYERARIFINPVFEGSGVNMKVGPPAERGIPVVTTPIGARGLEGLLPGLHIANDAKTFAANCTELMVNDQLWSEKSLKAKESVRQFSASSVGRMLVDLMIKSVASSSKG